MADTTTPNYHLVLIQVGASRDTWGNKVNDNVTAIDTALHDLSTALAGKLASASYTAADVLAKLLTVDGHTSGLDADTIDGQHASAFVLASSFSAAAVLAMLLTVDGTGSNLDADTVDGQHASAFAPAAHTHAYLPLGGGALTGSVTRSGEGVFPHFAAPGLTSGKLYIAPASGTDPTSQPGDAWLGY